MDASWLIELYREIGLEDREARSAAQATLARFVNRRAALARDERPRLSIRDSFTKDPLRSLFRIVGKGDDGLPFLDAEARTLSLTAFGDLFVEVGQDPIVAMAFARVMVEAYGPEDLYGPVWSLVAGEGSFDLAKLAQLDWAPLRARFPDLVEETPAATVDKPRAGPPVRPGRKK